MTRARVAMHQTMVTRDRYGMVPEGTIDPRGQLAGLSDETIAAARKLIIRDFGDDAPLALRMLGIDQVTVCTPCADEPTLGPAPASAHSCELRKLSA